MPVLLVSQKCIVWEVLPVVIRWWELDCEVRLQQFILTASGKIVWGNREECRSEVKDCQFAELFDHLRIFVDFHF